MSSLPVDITKEVTACIKHTSRFVRRRVMLRALLISMREYIGYSLRILVADDGGLADRNSLLGAELIELPAFAGLSAGRNALVHATRTPFLLLLDDDVVFHESTRIDMLLTTLNRHQNAVLAAGCYVDARFAREDCFNLRFRTDEGGMVVRAHTVPAMHGVQRVHAGHNFFVARTAALQRFGWDPRQKVMEHETFFYQLYLNQQEVLAVANVSVWHNTTRDEQYRERSFRLQEARFMQYLCKNYPEIARFQTPYLLWRCDTRTYCVPAWHAQFPYDGRECKPMQWNADDDRSTVARPLVAPAMDSLDRLRGDGSRSGDGQHTRPHVPLLALIFTEARNTARREWQRATWLPFRWHRGPLGHELVPWRHVFVMARSPQDASAEGNTSLLDRVYGDTVTLSRTTEGYDQLVFKTIEALRWALATFTFEVVLKVDDDSVVHIGRLWSWIYHELPKEDPGAPPPTQLYAGRVFRDSQVVRANFTRANLRHPDWFPASFRKWAVDESVYPLETYPPYCGGGGYLLGMEAAARVARESTGRDLSRMTGMPEDAFIGVLARAQGIVARDLLTFQEPPRGSLQTRETFIDQILVHRVMEPFKAFRWLMLSSNCHSGQKACEVAKNRTRGYSSQGPLPTSPDAAVLPEDGALPRYDKDWISGAIPHAAPDAFTGSTPSYDLPKSTGAAEPKQTRRKRKGRRWKKKNKRGSRNANAF